VKGSNSSIIPYIAGSLKSTDEIREETEQMARRNWQEIKPGQLLQITQPASHLGLQPFDPPVIVMVLDTAVRSWATSNIMLMTKAASGELTAVSLGWLNAVEGGMHFFPVLYEGQLATLSVWANDDGWQPVECN
jgi:hypothetical protein